MAQRDFCVQKCAACGEIDVLATTESSVQQRPLDSFAADTQAVALAWLSDPAAVDSLEFVEFIMEFGEPG